MSRKIRMFWEKYRSFVIPAFLIVLSLLLMALDNTPLADSMKKEISSVLIGVHKQIGIIPRLIKAEKENKQLLKQIGELSLKLHYSQEATEENIRLRRLLGLKNRNGFDVIPAEVIGMGTIGVPGSVHLNIGSEDGCRKNMVLMTESGVVGKLISISRYSSIGELLTDPNFRISAKVQRSRVLGIVRWLYGNICMLEGVPQESDVQVSDVIVTSGYSHIYPPGLPIGTVYQVDSQDESLFLTVLLKTQVEFESLESVLVLKSRPSISREEF
jgi:rod shape-determining protein MreC